MVGPSSASVCRNLKPNTNSQAARAHTISAGLHFAGAGSTLALSCPITSRYSATLSGVSANTVSTGRPSRNLSYGFSALIASPPLQILSRPESFCSLVPSFPVPSLPASHILRNHPLPSWPVVRVLRVPHIKPVHNLPLVQNPVQILVLLQAVIIPACCQHKSVRAEPIE